jgi:hypothetical protein
MVCRHPGLWPILMPVDYWCMKQHGGIPFDTESIELNGIPVSVSLLYQLFQPNDVWFRVVKEEQGEFICETRTSQEIADRHVEETILRLQRTAME